MQRLIPAVIAVAVLTACSSQTTAPRSDLHGLPAGLSVEFSVEPAQVVQHEPFTARLDVTNTTSRPLEVVTWHGCLATPSVMLNGQPVPFTGSAWVCTAAVTTHRFEPGETKTLSWTMRAELSAQGPDEDDGAPAPKATYQVKASFDVGTGGLRPTVERPLRVR